MPAYVPGVTFTDVPVGHWAEPDIAFLYERGLVGGYDEPDGTKTFRGQPTPEQLIAGHQTRYETTAFMARTLRISETALDALDATVIAISAALAAVPGQIAAASSAASTSGRDAALTYVRQNLRVNNPNTVTVPADASPVNSTVYNLPLRVTLP